MRTFKYGSNGQPQADKTILPEMLFDKSPPPGGTLGELTREWAGTQVPIEYTKLNMPLEYTELKILKGSEFFCNLCNLHKLHLEFHRFDRFSDIVTILGYYNALHIYNQIERRAKPALSTKSWSYPC